MDFTTLKAAFVGYLGFRQNEDASGVQLLDLTAPTSGFFINDVHPLLTFNNLLALAERYDKLGFNPTQVNSAFTDFLKRELEEGIVEAFRAWYYQKSKFSRAKGILESRRFFEGAPGLSIKVPTMTKAAGIEVTLSRSKIIKGTFFSIGLCFDTAQTITVYLFKSGEATPLKSIPLNYDTPNSVKWFSLTDWIITGEGSYYIVYDLGEITGQAYNTIYDYNFLGASYKSYPYSRYFGARGFSVDSDLSTLWDISKNSYTPDTNYGINLDLTIECDFTSLIVEQKAKFSELVLTSTAQRLLRGLAYNPAANVSRYNLNIDRSSVLYEIDGVEGKTGLGRRYKEALDSITFDYSGLDKICLPCKNKGVNYKSV